MATNVDVPNLGESVNEATLIRWHKADGESVKRDEPLCELETDKANVDVPAPTSGVIKRVAKEGDKVRIGQMIATIDPAGVPTAKSGSSAPAEKAPSRVDAEPKPAKADHATTPALSPAVRRLVEEHALDASTIRGTGPGNRITKGDVLDHLARPSAEPTGDGDFSPAAASVELPPSTDGVRRTPMSKIRKKIAERLVKAQHTAAILTTFNEVDLSHVMAIRSRFKDQFEKQHGVGLGFMSFFARAVCMALKAFPRVNAQIDGDDILMFDDVHLGIAVSTDRGLAVPVLRHADKMSFAKIESEIKRLADATRDGKLGLNDLSGGTFTITNGGVFGSLFATPILNTPQSGILGMHTIKKRPVVVDDQIVIRPMMYIALSYDHRLIDGKESVSFLVRVKELLEDPSRMLLEV
jgi:2-oxoglutarate dehydrogenase E2 component (dihydrolipoamide succinyltransferase)